MTLQSAPRVGRRLDYRYVRENSRHQHVVRADYSKLVHGPLARPRKAKTLKKPKMRKQTDGLGQVDRDQVLNVLFGRDG